MRYVIIANPASGRGRGTRLARELQALLLRHVGKTYAELQFTAAPGEAEAMARDAIAAAAATDNPRLCLVACGGDGTIQEVVNAMLPSGASTNGRVVLGVAPGGRCNDFASAFGIRPDARRVADILLAGHTQPIDIGRVTLDTSHAALRHASQSDAAASRDVSRVNQRCFCTVAAMGFDAAVARFVHQMKMPLVGTPAYIYGVLRVLFRYQPVPVRLAFRDTTIEGPVFLAATANTPSYGGRMRIAPDANAHDGQLDLCLVSNISRLRVLRLLHRVLDGRHADLPEIRMIRTPSLRIESSVRQEIWADGEFVAETPATIEVLPAAIQMLVPAIS